MPVNDTQTENQVNYFCITADGYDYFYECSGGSTLNDLLDEYGRLQNMPLVSDVYNNITKDEYENLRSDSSLIFAHIDKDNNRLTIAADGERKTLKLDDSVRQAKYEKSIGTPAKLLPLLNASYNNQLGRIDSFYMKKSARLNKIERNENKIVRLHEKVEHLKATNEMLRSMLGKSRIADVLIARNEEKIKKLQERSIPKCEAKIEKHRTAIKKLDRKIEISECKAAKARALSGVIKSLAVKDVSERRTQFAENLDNLHDASNKLLGVKLEKCEAQIARLNKKYIFSDSALEKNKLSIKLDKLNTRKYAISEKIKKLSGMERSFTQQSDKDIDNMTEQTFSHLDDAVKSESISDMTDISDISDISESVCEKNIEYLNKEEKPLDNDLKRDGHTFSEKAEKAAESKKEEKSGGFVFSVSKLKEASEMIKASQKQKGEISKPYKKEVSL